jgi:hypothetical protein
MHAAEDEKLGDKTQGIPMIKSRRMRKNFRKWVQKPSDRRLYESFWSDVFSQ